MGFSDREADAIDPGAADLLMPERRLRPRQPRMRDIEDASFETVVRGRMQHVRARTGSKPRPVFKSRMTDFPDAGPFPRDFALSDPAPGLRAEAGKRLGVFAGSKPAMSANRASARVAFAAMVGAAALAVFWMAGGHALLPAPSQEFRATVVAQPAASAAVEMPRGSQAPDPVVTSSVPAETGSSESGSIIHAKPRPARIERAGSILMIRPDDG
jgi:hypothetical protein